VSEQQEPVVERLEAQRYVAVRGEVTENSFRSFIDQNFSRPFEWLGSQGKAPAGPPLIRYLSLDNGGNPRLMDLGVPVAEPVEPDEDFIAGELPAGEYLTYLHVGPFQHENLTDLRDAVERMLAWAEENGVELDRTETDEGPEFGASAEYYLVDPSTEPDFTKWQTRIVMLTAG